MDSNPFARGNAAVDLGDRVSLGRVLASIGNNRVFGINGTVNRAKVSSFLNSTPEDRLIVGKWKHERHSVRASDVNNNLLILILSSGLFRKSDGVMERAADHGR